MAGSLNIKNANGKSGIINFPDTVNVDTTVDIDKIVVKDSNGNVGIGTSTPSRNLEVLGNTSILDITGTNQVLFAQIGDSNRIYSRIKATTADYPLTFWTGTTERMRIDSSGNIGIGSTPDNRLTISSDPLAYGGEAYRSNITIYDSNTAAAGVGGGIGFGGNYIGTSNRTTFATINAVKDNASTSDVGASLVFKTRGSATSPVERMRIDSSGNLGLGVTPSLWKSNRKAIEFPTSSISDNGSMSISVGVNNYENSSGQSIYKSNGYASANYQNAGGHYWLTAPSGTAGNPITWTSAMTLDASGNVGIGVTPSAWGSSWKVLDLPGAAFTGAYNNAYMFSNIYVDSGNTRYKVAAEAGYYGIEAGTHRWSSLPTGTAGAVATLSAKMTLDISGNLLLTSGTGALGYGTGAGGTVTQLTSKSTTVTLNKPSGKITMNNAALAAGASVSFWVANNLLDYTKDLVAVAIEANNNYRVEVEYLSSDVPGQIFSIRVTNTSGVSRSDALVLHFAIIKGANS